MQEQNKNDHIEGLETDRAFNGTNLEAVPNDETPSTDTELPQDEKFLSRNNLNNVNVNRNALQNRGNFDRYR